MWYNKYFIHTLIDLSQNIRIPNLYNIRISTICMYRLGVGMVLSFS